MAKYSFFSLLLMQSLFCLFEVNNAVVTLPSFFSSRMVLQAGPVQKAQIFGTTDDPDTDIDVDMSCFNCCNDYGPYRADIVSCFYVYYTSLQYTRILILHAKYNTHMCSKMLLQTAYSVLFIRSSLD